MGLGLSQGGGGELVTCSSQGRLGARPMPAAGPRWTKHQGREVGRGQRWWLGLMWCVLGASWARVLHPRLGPKLHPAQGYFQDEVAIGAPKSVREGTASCSVPLHASRSPPCCLHAGGSPGEGADSKACWGTGTPQEQSHSHRSLRNRLRVLRWHQLHGKGREDAASSPLRGCGWKILIAEVKTRCP